MSTSRRKREEIAQGLMPLAKVECHRNSRGDLVYKARCGVCPPLSFKGFVRVSAVASLLEWWTTHEDSGVHREHLSHPSDGGIVTPSGGLMVVTTLP